MVRAASILGAGLLSLSMHAGTVMADATYAPDTPPTVEIRTSKAFVSNTGWFRVNVYCVAPEGSGCNGSIGLTAVGIRPGFGHTLPLAIRHSYNLTAGSERALAIRLRPYGASQFETK